MKVIFLIIVLLVPFALSAQTSYPKESAFAVKKLHKYKEYFLSKPETSKPFKKFNDWRIAQRTVNILAIGIPVMAGIVSESKESDTEKFVIGFGGTMLGGFVAMIGNLITGPIKGHHKRKLLKIENDSNYGGHMQYNQNPFIAVGVTKNGVGVSYNF